MEKKTIGKFISALRRANGMTQKELGEKLFVSDKTVSRWECDESTPELSLIPSIAEIFGVTTDELLRGGRTKPDFIDNEEKTEKQKAKSDKQFKLLLHNRKKKYTSLSFISIGLAIVGLIAAMICNLGFYKGVLGFCLASIFFIASVICQICFTVHFRLLADDETEHTEAINKTNNGMVFFTVKILFCVLMLWAFSLPIAVMPLVYADSQWGLVIDSWLLFGALFAVITFVIAYCIYKLAVLNTLIKQKIIYFDEEEINRLNTSNKLLKKLCIIFATAFIVIMIATYVVTAVIGKHAFIVRQSFDNTGEFIEYVQTQYDEWLEEGEIPILDGEYPKRAWGEIDGKQYYYNPDLYYDIFIQQLENGQYSITVTTEKAYQNGTQAYKAVNAGLLSLHAVNLFLCVGYYCMSLFKQKRK